MTKASEMMERPTPRMKMDRTILHDQFSLMWFGGIMTFKHLGLVAQVRDGANIFKWSKENYSLTGSFDQLDQFVDGLQEISAEHLRPQTGCHLSVIEQYYKLLMKS